MHACDTLCTAHDAAHYATRSSLTDYTGEHDVALRRRITPTCATHTWLDMFVDTHTTQEESISILAD